MLSHGIDEETGLRLIEPRHAEALNALVERNLEHVREWRAASGGVDSAWRN